MSTLAPVGISTYIRIDHLKKTIEALRKNTLAKETDLYVFSDAPKKGDEEKVAAVREYLHGITGFKKTFVIEREDNSRVKNNRDGMRLLLSKYDELIFLEEDVVSSKYFLEYMNDALNKYRVVKECFAICSFIPPIEFIFYDNAETFHSTRFFSWGFAIWKDRFEQIEMDITREMYKELKSNKVALRRMYEKGKDVLPMIKLESLSIIDGLDVKIEYISGLKDKYFVCPKKSLVSNIGLDGSGEHCGETNRFVNTNVNNFKILVDTNVIFYPAVQKQIAEFYTGGWIKSLGRFTKMIGIYPYARKIKNWIRL